MFKRSLIILLLIIAASAVAALMRQVPSIVRASVAQEKPKAFIDGVGPGWRTLVESDFADVNGNPDTWEWRDGIIAGTGVPIGVYRTQKKVTNFELVVEWRHLRSGGN